MIVLSAAIDEAFRDLRAIRAATMSVSLTSAAARNLIAAMEEAGFDRMEAVQTAFTVVALGNQDARASWYKE